MLTLDAPTRLTNQTPLPHSLEITRIVPVEVHLGSQARTQEAATRVGDAAPIPEAPSRVPFPQVHDTFLGFRLVAELGSGAFGRVFLAEQVELANRLVALKVTTRATREAQRLARLRHTNVMPVYSVHDQAPLQALCMPFLGRYTLADMVKEYRSTGVFPGTVAHSASTVAQARTTHVNPKSHSALPLSDTPEATPSQILLPPTLAGATHTEAALWILTRLTDGLAHAHEMGILHLDLKPANVLVSDDGQPLLLDFNLAYDLWAADRERCGGTIPYMAPEQLDEFERPRQSECLLDERTDLYALGVIAFELLTGQHPFPLAVGTSISTRDMAKARRLAAPSPRAINPAISPAVDAIIRKLLQPKPADRYQSARDLLCDLDRHRLNLPLTIASNPSLRERLVKWNRRHPRTLLALGLVSTLTLVGALSVAAYRQATIQSTRTATDQALQIRTELATLRVDLTSRQASPTRTAKMARARAILTQFGDSASWTTHPAVQALSPTSRAELGADLQELALLLAHAESLAGHNQSPAVQAQAAEKALVWNRQAERFGSGRETPTALLRQRARLSAVANQSRIPSDLPTGSTSLDLYLQGAELIADGRYQQASKPLLELVGQEPAHFAGQFALGLCYQEMADRVRAFERYHMAQALVPTDPRPAYNRGIVLLFHGQLAEAEESFAQALKLDPVFADARLQRALVRKQRKNFEGMVEDLSLALTHGAPPIQVFHLRAEAYRNLEDPKAAERDLAAADQLKPSTAMDYLVRGYALLATKPTAALEDFVKASELEPTNLVAWQNQAHVLADVLDQPIKALEAQEKAVERYPEYAPARVGRGVLYARLGSREKAHADAQQAMVLSSDALVTYQAACVFALTAQGNPDDADYAVELFRKALRDGYRDFATIESDPDLANIRSRSDYQAALAAARELTRQEAK